MLKYLRWLLLPFSWLYGCIIAVRNWCYDIGIFRSQGFNLPVISIGNLDIGGAGKSPMAEYLIRLLKNDHKLATLSRGYGRETKGFLIADTNSNAAGIGDEPAQFKQKFPDITVAVCEKRVIGIEQLKQHHDLIILDDAYQHRAVKPGLSILLFEYSRIFEPHFILPAGNLREPFGGRKRADVIVITKCPPGLSDQQKQDIQIRVKPFNKQQLFFAGLSYGKLKNSNGIESKEIIDQSTTVFLLTGIANPTPLLNHVKKQAAKVIHHNYPDHHQFTLKNIAKLANDYEQYKTDKKLIITTEKDIQRLREHQLSVLIHQLPVLVLPIKVRFLAGSGAGFNQIIKNYVR